MKKIKIAQIGTSKYSHGNQIYNSLKKQDDIFEVVGYVFPEKEREKFNINPVLFEPEKEMPLSEVLNNPEIEAVTIETEEKYLTKYAKMSAEHGKHIYLEKPGGLDLFDFERLIETVKKNKTVFHLGYMYRYNPFIKELMQQIKRGDLGEIISVEAQMNSCHPSVQCQWLTDLPGGIMFFLGCHMIDLVLQIKGIPERIIPFNCSTGIDNISAEDFGAVVLSYKNGHSFVRTFANEVGGFARRKLVVTGTRKTVEICPLEILGPNGVQSRKTEYSKGESWDSNGENSVSKVYDRYDDMMYSFARMVKGEEKNPWDYDYELMLYKTILRCCEGDINESDFS